MRLLRTMGVAATVLTGGISVPVSHAADRAPNRDIEFTTVYKKYADRIQERIDRNERLQGHPFPLEQGP